MSLNDKSIPYEEIRDREDQQRFGYPGQIPLVEAVNQLNEEKHCIKGFEQYVDLTQDEVLASIASGSDDITPSESGKEILEKILDTKTLPKGSLLKIDHGSRLQGSVLRRDGTLQPTGIRISLFFGLDNADPRVQMAGWPTYSVVIRKNFSGFEIIR